VPDALTAILFNLIGLARGTLRAATLPHVQAEMQMQMTINID
jgi:hypothetical protein